MQEKHWLQEVQKATAEWREETIEGAITPRTQAIHTAVEAAEVADELVKAETYTAEADASATDAPRSVKERARTELGDVVVAHLGTVEMLGLEAGELMSDLGDVPYTEDVLETSVEIQYVAIKLSHAADIADETQRRYARNILGYAELLAGRLGSDLEECVDAALEKNGARDWQGWQGE